MDVISQTREIYFASGSASIDQTESAPVFDAVAQFFNRCPSVSMVIAGHTESNGSAACNQDLSARRADAVAQALTVNQSRCPAAWFLAPYPQQGLQLRPVLFHAVIRPAVP
jgi:outer membrane protein OmpA-like peptidoglycan-associated protein